MTLDLAQPVAVLLVAVLMYFHDSEDPNPAGMVSTLLEPMSSGSYLAITHPTADFDPQAMAGAAAAEQAGVTLVPRSRRTEAFFAGLGLVEPGVVPVLAWRPDAEPPADPHSADYWAGVGRRP